MDNAQDVVVTESINCSLVPTLRIRLFGRFGGGGRGAYSFCISHKIYITHVTYVVFAIYFVSCKSELPITYKCALT